MPLPRNHHCHGLTDKSEDLIYSKHTVAFEMNPIQIKSWLKTWLLILLSHFWQLSMCEWKGLISLCKTWKSSPKSQNNSELPNASINKSKCTCYFFLFFSFMATVLILLCLQVLALLDCKGHCIMYFPTIFSTLFPLQLCENSDKYRDQEVLHAVWAGRGN